MGLFVAERYVSARPSQRPAGTAAAAARPDQQAASAARAGHVAIRHVRTWYLLSDETCLALFEAPSADSVRAAGNAIGLRYSRVTEAVEAASDPAHDGGTRS